MSTKITQVQLDANNKTYAVEDYRKMVNYESGTNKGYVRFTKDSSGALKLEKFNNKVDVPLSWRSNTSEAHNRAMREKFLAAMERDLRYMGGDSANTIRKMILAPKKPGENVESPGKALSRRDVKAILEKFDEQFNSGAGRMVILKNFISDAKLKCGFAGTDDEFCRDYLKTADAGIDFRFTEYISRKEGEGVDALPKHLQMVKSEAEFRQLVFRLDGLVDAAKQRLCVETTLKSVAKSLAENGGGFGVKLGVEAEGSLRAALSSLLAKAGVEDVDLGFGTRNTALEMFIKNVVPVMVREGAENLKDIAASTGKESVKQLLSDDSRKDDVEWALDADFNIDRVFSLAREFVEGAKAAVEDMKDVPEGKDAFDSYVSGMRQVFDEQLAKVKQVAVFNEARKVFILDTNAGKQASIALAQEVGSLTPQFVKEAKLDTYTVKFLKSHFARSVDAAAAKDENFMEKANEVIEHVKIAGQLNYGERWQKDPNAKFDSNLKLMAGGSVQSFLQEMGRRVAVIVNEKKGGLPLYEKLMGLTLTAILNQKIENATDSKGLARLYIDVTGFAEVETRLRRTVDAYCRFRDGKGAVIVEKAVDAFRRQLDRLAKKGNIDQQAYNMLLTDFQSRMKTAFDNAAARFLSEAPRSADLDAEDTLRADLTALTNALNEEKCEALAEMRGRIATTVLTRGLNQDVRKALVTDMDERIGECAQRLRQDGIAPKFAADEATMAEALKKLYYKVLADKCGKKAIAGQRIDEGLVDAVKSAFHSAAKDLVKNANKLADLVDDEFKTMAGVAAGGLFESQESRRHYKADLPKKEYDAMQESLRADLTLALKTRTDELKRRFLLNPEAYTKKEVGDFKAVGEIFDRVGKDGVYTQNSVTRVFSDVVNARYTAVMGWLHNPTGPDGKGTFESDMVASEKLRLAEPAAGKAGEFAKTLPANELGNIVGQAVKAVLASAEKYAISYASGGKTAFLKRVSDEIKAIVDRHVEAHAKFREQFVKDAQPYLAKYVDALRTKEKDGVQVATDKMNAVLDEISRMKEPPAVKGFAVAFDGMLQKLVNERVDMKMDEFLAYSAKVTEAYGKCIPAFNEAMAAHRDGLKAAGATDEDMKFFDEKLAPVMRSNLETDLQRNIDSKYVMSGAAPYGRAMADSLADQFATALKDSDMSDRMSLMTMLSDLGLKELYADDDTFKATQDAVAAWMKSPDVQKLAAGLRQARMTLVACGSGSMCRAAIDARATVEGFKKELLSAIMGLKAAVLETAFNMDEVAPAMSLFKVWIKRYGLPPLRVSMQGQGDITLEEAAINHFRERVATMQKKIADNPDVREPLLSEAYLKEFTQFLNTIGTKAMFRDLEAKLVNGKVQEILGEQGISAIYNFSEQYGDDASAQLRREVAAQNMKDLVNTITGLLDRTRRAMKDFTVTLEQMQRWEEVIVTQFNNMIGDESLRIGRLHEFAKSRVAMMASIDLNIVSGEQAVKNYVSTALKAYFDGRDVAAGDGLGVKFFSKRQADIDALVGHLTEMAVKAVKASAAGLKADAMKFVQPGDTLAPLPGVAELKGRFLDIAKATVMAVASDKKDVHSATLKAIAKELGIKK